MINTGSRQLTAQTKALHPVESMSNCLYCTVKFNHSNIPFTASCVSELININQSDSLEFLNFLPSLEIVNETASYEKYHIVEDFQKLDIQDNFNNFMQM